MGGHGPTLLSTQKISYLAKSIANQDQKEINEKIEKMRGHNFNFRSIEKPHMMSTFQANFKDTVGAVDGNDMKSAL